MALKDHRPDLKQAVLELMVTQDGGVPLMSQRWDGHASDSVVFKERCEALLTQFADIFGIGVALLASDAQRRRTGAA